MKATRFTLNIMVSVLLSASAWAGDKMKANILIDQTVRIGSTQLAPGEYKMTWTENGSNAEVTFSHGKKVIVTVPAQAIHKRSGYSSPELLIDRVSNTLLGVDLSEESFSFTSEDAAPAR